MPAVAEHEPNKPLFISVRLKQGTQQKIPVTERNEEKKHKENKAKRPENGDEITK